MMALFMKDGEQMSGTHKNGTRSARFVTVTAPEPYEGVGRALASAFSAIDQSDLPRDMVDLLQRLDSVGKREQAGQDEGRRQHRA